MRGYKPVRQQLILIWPWLKCGVSSWVSTTCLQVIPVTTTEKNKKGGKQAVKKPPALEESDKQRVEALTTQNLLNLKFKRISLIHINPVAFPTGILLVDCLYPQVQEESKSTVRTHVRLLVEEDTVFSFVDISVYISH